MLSVAIDAVSKVDGEKALCGLITRAYFRPVHSSCSSNPITDVFYSFTHAFGQHSHLHSSVSNNYVHVIGHVYDITIGLHVLLDCGSKHIVFSKCKAGIQDGQRLENMAWRLWHVERFERSPSTHHLCFPASPDTSSPGGIASLITSCPSSASSSDSASQSSGSECSDQEDVEWDKDELTAIDSKPSPLLGASPSPLNHPKDHTHAQKHRKADMTLSASPPPRRNPHSRERSCSRERDEARPLAQAHSDGHQFDRRPSFSTRRTYSNTSVGKIMADLLPEKLDVMGLDAKRRRPSNSSTTSAVSDSTAAISLGLRAKVLSEEDRWHASSSTLVRDDQESATVSTEVPVVIQHIIQVRSSYSCFIHSASSLSSPRNCCNII